jgi:hypothetical protein
LANYSWLSYKVNSLDQRYIREVLGGIDVEGFTNAMYLCASQPSLDPPHY